MKYILPILVACTLAACHPPNHQSNSVDRNKWIDASLHRIPPFGHGWSISGFGGGATIDGSSYKYSLRPESKPVGECISEFKELLKQQLIKDGFKIVGEGSGGSSAGDHNFSFQVKSDFFSGTLVFAFSPTSDKDIFGLVAIAQVPTFKTEQGAAANP